MSEVDKNENHWTTFLKGLGIRVDLGTVKKVANQVVSHAPLHPLYASQGTIPVAGKGTVYKIMRLIENGELDPLLLYWGLKETPEVDTIQLAHLRDLRKFLQEDPRIRESFTITAPGRIMESILEQLVPRLIPCQFGPWLRKSGFTWETLPIISKIRSHCSENQLWKDIDEWKSRHDEYERSISDIAEKLQAEFDAPLHFPGSTINNPTMERRLLLDIFSWLLGQLTGNIPTFWRIRTVEEAEQKGYGRTFCLVSGDVYYARGTEDQIERVRATAEDVLKRWSDSDDIGSLVRQYYSLEVLAQRLRKGIDRIDEAVLARGKCPDCPILRSEQKVRK